MAVKALATLSDFTLGELSPRFLGMSDRPEYYQGCSLLKNWMPARQGGLRLRPGTVYQGESASNAVSRLIPFVIDTSTAFIVELTADLMRFWKWNGTGLTHVSGQDIVTTYTSAELIQIQYAANFPYLFLVHPNHPPAMVTWASGDTFTSADIPFSGSNVGFFTATITGGTAVALTVGALTPDIPGGATYNNYVGSAVTGSGVLTGTTVASVTDSTHFTLSGAATNASGVALAVSQPYILNSTPALPFQSSGNYPSAVCVAFQRCFFANTNNNPLGVWASVVGMWDANGNMQMGTYETVQYQDPQMNVDSNGQPTAQPPTYTTTYENHNIIGDADGIYVTINSDRNDQVQWIAPDVDLFLGTASGLWVTPASSTANNISFQLVNRQGSAPVQSSMVGGGCVFAQLYARRVGQVGWQGIYNPWIPPDDLTFFADHIFQTQPIVQWDHADNPETMIYFLRNDGTIAALLMDDAHKVRGWWQLTTGGTINSVAVITGSDRDVLFMSVTRNSNNTIEMLASPDWYDTTKQNDGEETAVFLDAATVQTGAATTVTGLSYLNGLTVGIVGDGAWQGTATVSGGSITLPTAVTRVAIAGVQYTATMQSMPIEGQKGSLFVTFFKATTKIYLRLLRAFSIQVGQDSSTLTTPVLPGVTVANVDPASFTGDLPVRVRQASRSPAYVLVEHTIGLPCEINAIQVESTMGTTE